MTRKVARPGSRGGQFYVNAAGAIVYGKQPDGTTRPVAADPTAPPPPPVVPVDKLHIPHYGEFGEWSPDAALLYLRQALVATPALRRVAGRFRMATAQGLREGLAGNFAFRSLQPQEIADATAGLKRVGRLRDWDDASRRERDEEPTRLPAPNADLSAPFVRAAVRAGVPTPTATRWYALVNSDDDQGTQPDDDADAALAARLLGREPADPPVRKARPLPLLMKAVMRPGSRGGHVYWANGRLHYGTPTFGAPAARQSRTPVIKPSWQAVGRVARGIIGKGKRILYTASDGSRQWGDIVSAAGEILSVLPDNAPVYDLLHTVCVPVENVVRVIPDARMEKSRGTEADRLEKSLGGYTVADRQAHESAADFAPWPEAEAEE